MGSGSRDRGHRLCPGERALGNLVNALCEASAPDDHKDATTAYAAGRLHHIGIGNAYAGWRAGGRAAMLIDGLKIEIVGLDGSPLRRLVLDPTNDYQRIP
jgi:hypothetical protein